MRAVVLPLIKVTPLPGQLNNGHHLRPSSRESFLCLPALTLRPAIPPPWAATPCPRPASAPSPPLCSARRRARWCWPWRAATLGRGLLRASYTASGQEYLHRHHCQIGRPAPVDRSNRMMKVVHDYPWRCNDSGRPAAPVPCTYIPPCPGP